VQSESERGQRSHELRVIRAASPFPQEEVQRRLPAEIECMAFRVKEGQFRAVCLDFSLIAESGTSLLDAQKRLESQLVDYVQDVIEEGCPPHLVRRGLSAWERRHLMARFYWAGLRGLLGSLPLFPDGSSSDRATWKQPLPAC